MAKHQAPPAVNELNYRLAHRHSPGGLVSHTRSTFLFLVNASSTCSAGEFTSWLTAQRDTLAREARGTSLLDYWEQVINDRYRCVLCAVILRQTTSSVVVVAQILLLVLFSR